MNATGIEILSNPQPSAHIVYCYNHASQLADAVSLFSTSGLKKGEAVLLILSGSHFGTVRTELCREGFNLAELEATGQLVCEDAKSLLDTFMFDGILDEDKFKNKMDRMIERAKLGRNGRTQRLVRVFGEMVDLTWEAHPKVTERLETLWNEVIKIHTVPLLCAYSLAGKLASLPEPLMCCHFHAVA